MSFLKMFQLPQKHAILKHIYLKLKLLRNDTKKIERDFSNILENIF